MKIKLIRPATIGGERLGEGSELDLSPVHAQALIDGGKAELLEQSSRKAVIEPPETPEASSAEIPPESPAVEIQPDSGVEESEVEDPPSEDLPDHSMRAKNRSRKKT